MGAFAESVFEDGLCLPSGTADDATRPVELLTIVRECFR
jgi:hypothetical protein